MHRIVVMFALLSCASACWPGRCGGALRGTPMVSFTGDHSPCTEGSSCAEPIGAEARFHQRGDFARVDDPASLIASAVLGPDTWFLVDADEHVIPSRIEARSHDSAHSCASAIGFELVPDAPLEPGVYRLVLMVDRVAWPVLRQGVALSTFGDEAAVVQFYRVDP